MTTKKQEPSLTTGPKNDAVVPAKPVKEIAKKTKTAAPHRYWRRLTVFSAICAMIAAGYLGYRALLVTSFSDLGSLFRTQQAEIAVGCSDDGVITKSDSIKPLPVFSKDYQQFIASQPALSGNLVKNSALTQNRDGSIPGFSKTVDASWARYEYLVDDSKPFLRTTITEAITADGIAASWIMDPVTVEKDKTYVVSFVYRSSAPVVVSSEYVMPDGQIIHQSVTELEKSDSWLTFTAYASNPKQARSFRFVAFNKQPGTLDTRGYDIHNIASAQLDRGMVTIAFDDGWQSVADKALPVLDKYGYKTTQFIISDVAEHTVGGYMDAETLNAMNDAGHEMGWHSRIHCDQTNLSNDAIAKDAVDGKRDLEALGLGPIESFAYPRGAHNQETREVFAREYNYLRTSDAGYNDRYFDAGNIRSMGVLETTTNEEIQSWLRYASENKVWLVLVYHRVDEHGEFNVSSATFDQHMELVQKSGLPVVPFDQAAKSIR